MTRRKQKEFAFKDVTSIDPRTPLGRGNYRDKAFVKSIMLRMGTLYINQLDHLCKINDRSRREIVELLIHHATHELSEDPESRINPL